MNVYLVDDEYWTLQSIKAKVDWAGYDMKVIGEAYNGQEGLKEIIRLKPDLVFTDIRMPGLTGLELIEQVREAGLQTLFIIISGYSEFEYAQRALHLGAEGYILKSFDEQEIRHVLEAVMKKRKASMEADMVRLMGALLSGTSESESDVRSILDKWGFAQNEGTYNVAILRDDQIPSSVEMSALGVLRLVTGKYTNAFVMRTDGLQSFLLELPSGMRGIGLSQPFSHAGELSDAIGEAAEASCQYFISGHTGEAYPYQTALASIQERLLQLYEAIRLKDTAEITDCLNGMKQRADRGELSIKQIFQFYNSVMSFVFRMESEEDRFVYSYEALLGMFSDIDELLGKMKQLILEKLNKESVSRPDEDSHENTKKFVGYIKERYFDNLTIHHLASHFNFNPNYISQLFQKELQTTFTKYLLQFRLERACLLLRETGLSVSEVAEKVGYSDYFYFAKIFKKSFNMTPTQFRVGNAI